MLIITKHKRTYVENMNNENRLLTRENPPDAVVCILNRMFFGRHTECLPRILDSFGAKAMNLETK